MTLIVILFQCSLFLLTPILVFSFGFLLIRRFLKKQENIFTPILIGFTFSLTTMVGMLIDPRGGLTEIDFIIKISLIVGISVILFIFVLLPIYKWIYNTFNK